MNGKGDEEKTIGVDTDHARIEETREALAGEKRPGGLAAEAEAHRARVGRTGTPEDEIKHDAADRGIMAAVASRPT